MRSLGWVRIHYDQYPIYKMRQCGHRHVQREVQAKIHKEDGYLQAKEKGLQRKQLCQHPDRFWPLGWWENKFLLLKPITLWYFVMQPTLTSAGTWWVLKKGLETASLMRPPNLVLPAPMLSSGVGISGALGTWRPAAWVPSGLLSAEQALVDRNIHPHHTETDSLAHTWHSSWN